MKKLVQVFLPVLQGFLVCAAVLQIVPGIVYIGKNFMAVPQFRDTTIYLEMSERFVVDEYTGILYPLLVKLCKSICFLPYQIPILYVHGQSRRFRLLCAHCGSIPYHLWRRLM